jgi:hypothetical protein
VAQALPAAGAGISSPESEHRNPGYAIKAGFKTQLRVMSPGARSTRGQAGRE